jgi:TRAP-type C4-dicarboxylate transport system permease large subunit
MAVNRKIKWKDMPALIIRSQVVAATILFIIAMAKVFTWLVAMKQTPMLLQSAITSLALPPWGLLLLVMAGLMSLGCIMETTAAVARTGAGSPHAADGVDPIQFVSSWW